MFEHRKRIYEYEMSSSDEEDNETPFLLPLSGKGLLRQFLKEIGHVHDHSEAVRVLENSDPYGFYNWQGDINVSLLLYSAVLWSDESAIELFLRHNAVASNRTLCRAVRRCNVDTLKKLLQSRDPQEQPEKSTPLHVAAKHKTSTSIAKIKILIEHNYDVNARSGSLRDYGHTPLYIAVVKRNTYVIPTLLRCGADPTDGAGRNLQIKLSPLFMCFTLPVNIVMDIVKYAALHISKKKQEKSFPMYFSQSSHGRIFKYYAERCLSEVMILQCLSIGSDSKNLFEFVLSHDQEKFFEESHKIFNILASLRLPNYKDLILRKFNREDIFGRIVYLTWNIDYVNKKLNSDCMYSICKYLCKKDLMSLWIALTYNIKAAD